MTQNSAPLEIRPARAADAPALAQIERACFGQNAWSEQALASETARPDAVVLAACRDGRVIGYIGMRHVLGEGYLNDLAVAPACRRGGAGLALITALIAQSRAMGLTFLTLEARVSNAAAIALYLKSGFADAGLRPGFYDAPREDARLMTLYL